MSFLFPFGLLRRFFNVKAEEHSPEVDKTTSKGKVVVGGGTGFVGTELCRLLRRNHYDIVIVSRYYKLRFNNPIFTICHFYLTTLIFDIQVKEGTYTSGRPTDVLGWAVKVWIAPRNKSCRQSCRTERSRPSKFVDSEVSTVGKWTTLPVHYFNGTTNPLEERPD